MEYLFLGLCAALCIMVFVVRMIQREQKEIRRQQKEMNDKIEKLAEAQSFESYRNIVLTNNYISEQMRELNEEG